MQSFKESYQSRRFRRTQVFPVGRHVAAALDYLSNKLILRKPESDTVERGPAFASHIIQ